MLGLWALGPAEAAPWAMDPEAATHWAVDPVASDLWLIESVVSLPWGLDPDSAIQPALSLGSANQTVSFLVFLSEKEQIIIINLSDPK